MKFKVGDAVIVKESHEGGPSPGYTTYISEFISESKVRIPYDNGHTVYSNTPSWIMPIDKLILVNAHKKANIRRKIA